MTALLAFLRLTWPYLACLGIGLWTGGYLVGNHWQARYAHLQTSDAQARADGEDAVRKALQAQLAQAEAVSENNAQIVEKLNAENAQIAADRDGSLTRVRRLEQLLVLASRASSANPSVSKTGGGPAAPGAGDPASTSPLEGLLVDAAAECEQTANQLNALIREIGPQL